MHTTKIPAAILFLTLIPGLGMQSAEPEKADFNFEYGAAIEQVVLLRATYRVSPYFEAGLGGSYGHRSFGDGLDYTGIRPPAIAFGQYRFSYFNARAYLFGRFYLFEGNPFQMSLYYGRDSGARGSFQMTVVEAVGGVPLQPSMRVGTIHEESHEFFGFTIGTTIFSTGQFEFCIEGGFLASTWHDSPGPVIQYSSGVRHQSLEEDIAVQAYEKWSTNQIYGALPQGYLFLAFFVRVPLR